MKTKIIFSLFFLTFLAGFTQHVAAQTTWTVTSDADDGTAGTLRYAIYNAVSGDNIVFDSGITTITLSSELGTTRNNLTVDGGGVVTLLLNSAGYFHIHIQSSIISLTLKGITLKGLGDGSGGIRTSGNLTLENCIISNCYQSSVSAIYSGGTATLTNCTVSGNSGFNGGGINANLSLILTNCTVSGNSASSGGGGIYANSSATLTNCTVSGNSASNVGGGILVVGAITLLGSVVSGNYYTGVAGVSASEIIFSSVSGTTYNGDGTLTTAGTASFATSKYYILGIPSGGALSDILQTDAGNPLLADHGGATQTILPVMHSIMLDAVPAAEFVAWGITADQRGNPRPTTGYGTVGALEATHALAPVINAQPQDLTLSYGESGKSLSVNASSPDGGTLSFQWYSNTSASNTGGSQISGATGSSFTPPTTAAGTFFYYVVVTNTKTGFDIPTDAAASMAAKVTVAPPTPTQSTPGMILTATGGSYSVNAVTLTATVGAGVQGPAYKPAPTGAVTFYEGNIALGTKTLNRYGVASFVVESPVDPGSHTFTAEYAGDANYTGDVSDPCTVDVSAFLSVAPAALHFDAPGGMQPVSIECTAGWSLSCDARWITTTVSESESTDTHIVLDVTAAANPDAAQRKALITVSIPGVMIKTVSVTQDAGVNPATGLQATGTPSTTVYSQAGNVVVKSDTPIQSVAVYDISGKLLKQVKGENTIVTINGLPRQQVLVVKVTDVREGSYKLRIEN